MLSFFKTSVLSCACLAATACDVPSKNYRDTTALEQPPQLTVLNNYSEQSTATTDETQKRKGLSDLVVSMDDTHLLLKQPLGTAWKTLEAAIKQSGLELADRNLEKGFYYVSYDPETFTSNTGQSWATKIDDFLFPEEKKNEPMYVISMRPKTDSIIIHTVLLDTVKTDKPVKDASAQLLTVLFKALYDYFGPYYQLPSTKPNEKLIPGCELVKDNGRYVNDCSNRPAEDINIDHTSD